MQTINNEYVTFWDIDGTLVIHAVDTNLPSVWVEDPVTKTQIRMSVNQPMVRLLLEEKHRGSFIIAWSRGGYEWAENVIKALKLTHKVDLVMSKPLAYFDDLDIAEWLKYRVYLKPDTVYKNTNK